MVVSKNIEQIIRVIFVYGTTVSNLSIKCYPLIHKSMCFVDSLTNMYATLLGFTILDGSHVWPIQDSKPTLLCVYISGTVGFNLLGFYLMIICIKIDSFDFMKLSSFYLKRFDEKLPSTVVTISSLLQTEVLWLQIMNKRTNRFVNISAFLCQFEK